MKWLGNGYYNNRMMKIWENWKIQKKIGAEYKSHETHFIFNKV